MRKIGLVLLVLCAHFANAQVSNYTFTKESGQLTEITAIPGIVLTNHTIGDDMVFPAKIAIPFPFKFNGTLYDSIGICENGFIWFGDVDPQAMEDITTPITAAFPSNVKGIVSALGADLHPRIGFDNGGVETTIKSGWAGTAQQRELIIEWRNTSRFEALADAFGADTITFQIKLYEFLNRIEVAYGNFNLNTSVPTSAEVGLLGATTTDFNTRATDATHNWTNSVAGTQNTDVCDVDGTFKPNYGDLFVWMNVNQPNGIENPIANNVRTYPNPTANVLFFEGNSGEANTIVVTNSMGQRVLQTNFDGTNAQIEMGNHANGLYFYQVLAANGQAIANGKFMLNK